MLPFRGRCHTCGHDHDAEDTRLRDLLDICQRSGAFKRGDLVRKVRGSQWQGRVVGEYSTALTPEGYAVESEVHAGSVQIYPASMLELVERIGATNEQTFAGPTIRAVTVGGTGCGESGHDEGKCGNASCLRGA